MKIKALMGKLLRSARAGEAGLTSRIPEIAAAPKTIVMTSPVFGDGQPMPARYTAKGQEVSPPINWTKIPAGTKQLLLMTEDADAPLPWPIVHAIVYGIHESEKGLEEGALPSKSGPGRTAMPIDFQMGNNTFGKPMWLGPDPVPGHGVHRYFFQIFALDKQLTFETPPKKKQVLALINGHVIARGELVGTFVVDAEAA